MTIHNKLLQGDLKDRIKEGYMVIGPNVVDGATTTCHADTEEMAVELAKHFSQTTGCCYEIIQYQFLGVVRPIKPIAEYYKPEKEGEAG